MARDIRHWQMENRATATLNDQYLTRPADWVETIRFYSARQRDQTSAVFKHSGNGPEKIEQQ